MQQLFKLDKFDLDPTVEASRLSALTEYGVVSSVPETAFDNLARIATLACDTSAFAIALAERDSLSFKAVINYSQRQLQYFTDHIYAKAIGSDDPYIVNSICLTDTPLNQQESFGFYAALPLYGETNQIVGAICVADAFPRPNERFSVEALTRIARQVEHEIQTKRLASLHTQDWSKCNASVEQLRVSETRLESALAGLSLVNDIGRAARSGDEPTSILEMAVAQLGIALSADRCYYVTYDPTENLGTIGPDWCCKGLKSISAEYKMFDFPYNRDPSFHSGKTSVIEDIMELSVDEGTTFSMSLGLRSLLRVPIQRGNQMTALGVAMSVPRKWTEDEIRLVETVAAQTRAAVETASQVLRERTLLRDVLVSVTEGKLRLAESEYRLPPLFHLVGEPVHLSRAGGLSKLRQLSKLASSMANHSEVRSYDLMLAAGEAGMNAIVHAKTGKAYVSVGDEGTVQVKIVDHGTGIALENIPKATLARGYSTKATLGHGLKMMLETVDRIHLLTGPTGTTVVLEQEKSEPDVMWGMA